MSIPRNLGNFADNVDTNGQVSLTTGVTGSLPVANGGTGSTSTTFVNAATNVTGTLPVANGGTGQTTYTNGQLLIGNTTGNTLTKATLSAGSGITITNGAGSITIAAGGGGVTSFVGQTGAVDPTVAYAIGSVVIGRPQNNTSYGVSSTLAGSSLYSVSSTAFWDNPSSSWRVTYGSGITGLSTLINTGSWRCTSIAGQDNTGANGYCGIWMRYA